MDPEGIARWFGILFWITFLTSIPAFFIFYAPVLDETDYVLGAGSDAQVQLGALLEVILIIANIGTAVVIYPIVRRQNEIAAIGYASRWNQWTKPSNGPSGFPLSLVVSPRPRERSRSGECSSRRTSVSQPRADGQVTPWARLLQFAAAEVTKSSAEGLGTSSDGLAVSPAG